MNILEIIEDSMKYPINNMQDIFIKYIGLAIVIAVIAALTGVSALFAGNTVNLALAIIGIILIIIIGLFIEGYMLDIIKYAINRRNDAPELNVGRQVVNGVKLYIVLLVYYIIPFLLTLVVGIFLSQWITLIIGIILFVIFGLASFTAQCRLAYTEDLNSALNIGEAIQDIMRVGIVKLIVTVIIVAIIGAILVTVAEYIPYIGGFLAIIVGVYIEFFSSRAMGLIYSDIS